MRPLLLSLTVLLSTCRAATAAAETAPAVDRRQEYEGVCRTRQQRAALTEELELSPPRIPLGSYGSVLAAAQRAHAEAHAKAYPDAEPSKRPRIACGQDPAVEERAGGFRFTWDHVSSDHSGYRVVAERAQDGKTSIVEVIFGHGLGGVQP